MELEEPETKRFKHSTISDRIYTQEFQDLFVKNWHNGNSIESKDITIISKPFRVCKISNFIKSESFMEELKNELSEVKSRRQSIDLYQFEQTSDLANIETTNVRRLWETFQSDLSTWMEKNTKIELNKKISMSSSCYYDTDYLLCHDDNMGDRRIAFILYLSKNWTIQDGGTLDLFDTDENGLPRQVVHSLVPEYNSLVFFEVVENSYHQVAEVKSSDKSRWTINGWFHGPLSMSNRSQRPDLEVSFVRPDSTQLVKLENWITNSYLVPDIVKDIQKDVEFKSYTFLSNFLKNDIYEKLSRDVTSETIVWKRVGPADLRNYEIAVIDSLPDTLRQFCQLFSSIEAFRLLKQYTELDLVPDEAAFMDPKMIIELQRWSNGCYTLICDRPAGYENSTRDEVGEFHDNSIETCTSNGSTRFSSRSRNDEKNRRISTSSNEDINEGEILKRLLRGKSPRSMKIINNDGPQQNASCSKLDKNLTNPSKFDKNSKIHLPLNPDSEDSDVSDIGDYLSDQFDCSVECSETEDEIDAGESSVAEPGTLDVIMQFHTSQIPENDTIDYVDPREQEGALIHVPYKDNHLCLVYKTLGTNRLHKYVNHYCKGYFYNLICTYQE